MNEAPYCDDRNRGRIILPEKARRLCDMRTMRMNGGITPTDVDGWFCHPARLTGLVEYRRSSYWLHEFKPLGGDMKEGQRIALECLVDDLASSGRYAVLVLAIEPPGTHEFKPSEAKVLKVRFAYAWHVSAPITLLAAWQRWETSALKIEAGTITVEPDGSVWDAAVFPLSESEKTHHTCHS